MWGGLIVAPGSQSDSGAFTPTGERTCHRFDRRWSGNQGEWRRPFRATMIRPDAWCLGRALEMPSSRNGIEA
jgi:hypothetical protein